MKRRVSIKQMFIDLLLILPQVNSYARGDEKFNELLNFLNDKNYYLNDELPIPTFKEISEETGIPINKLRGLIKNLYMGLVNEVNGFCFNFNKTEVIFVAEFLKTYASFRTKDLRFVPREGEQIDIPFFRGKLGTSLFYVKDISHSFENDRHVVNIRLQPGRYNMYSHFRLDKALALGEVGYQDFFESSVYEIQERLG
ncbi:hypothetical protein [Maribacter thermophilus]|uniref:hypothetical protein n=1 Tax=Maribacter thermophilus TaxID=1197874 RepID=UPI000640D930|nr:hypothetical protein [Maribacter thermophilus]